MIDLHSHILPALDDGALDMADSLALARQAQQDGIAVVCATPHIRSDHDVRIEELPARVAELQSELRRSAVGVRIACGGEVSQLSAADLSDRHLRAVSLDGGGWILLEPAPGALDGELVGLVRSLAGRGAHCVIAHPERHAGEDFVARLQELVDSGCLIQWTAEFIAERDSGDPDDFVLGLARDGLVHLLGSDAHSSHGGRPLRLGEGFARLREVCPPEHVHWMAEVAPAAILRGECPAVPW